MKSDMEEAVFGFEELILWQRIREFKKAVCKEARNFPPEEKYRLIDQIFRSSRSINAKIAEGHGRYTYPDQIHYCVQARGSLTETVNHLIDAFDEDYISLEKLEHYKSKAKEIERLLNGYTSFLRMKKDKQEDRKNSS